MLDRLEALEGRREPASVEVGGARSGVGGARSDVGGARSGSPTPSSASQASTPSAASDPAASLDLALGLPDDDLRHEADKHLSKQWAKRLSSAKLTLDHKSTLAVVNNLLCLGRSHRLLSYVLDLLLDPNVGHDDSRRC
jgi:hypothetical protein